MISVKEFSQRENIPLRTAYKKIEDGVFPYDKFVYNNGYFIHPIDFAKYFRSPVKDLTKYPELFDCYWGTFVLSRLADEQEKINEIIENRNRFVEEYEIYGISSRTIKIGGGHKDAFDHVEKYLSRKRRGEALIVSSPYKTKAEIFSCIGSDFKFDFLPDLYGADSTSFCFWYSENKAHLKSKNCCYYG